MVLTAAIQISMNYLMQLISKKSIEQWTKYRALGNTLSDRQWKCKTPINIWQVAADPHNYIGVKSIQLKLL